MSVEIVSKRTLHSKTYDLGNGQRRLVARQHPMHYMREEFDVDEKDEQFSVGSSLQDIDMSVKDGGVHTCPYDIDLYPDKVGYYGTAPDGKAISLVVDVPYVPPVIDGNSLFSKITAGAKSMLSYV